MKKTVITLAAIALAVNAFADSKSDALLAALAGKVAGWGDYRVEFTVTIDGQALSGSYEVSGDEYHLVTPDVELFCDGTVRREANAINREVTVDRVDPDDKTVLGNPTRLFDFVDGSYTHRYLGAAMVNGVKCERIELRDAGNPDGQKIEAFVAVETGMPVRLTYGMAFLNTDAVIDVVRVTPRVALGGSFRFDAARFAGWEVVDFR
jgi:hypothetical protein